MVVIYESPFSSALKKLKIVSIVGSLGAVTAAPTLLYFTESPLPFAAKATAAGAVLFTGLGSTSLLTWYLKPYCFRIEAKGDKTLESLAKLSRDELKKEALKFVTLDMLGREKVREIEIGKLQEAKTWRPMVSWQHKEKAGLELFAHEELLMTTLAGDKVLKEIKRSS